MTTDLEHLSKILRSELVYRFKIKQTVQNDTALFSTGLIDSLNVIDLVNLVEEQLGCSIPPAEITLENFDSIRRIACFASKLCAIGHSK